MTASPVPPLLVGSHFELARPRLPAPHPRPAAHAGLDASAYVVVTIRQLHATEHTSTIFAAQCVYGLLFCAVPAVATYEPLSPLAWAILAVAAVTAGIGQLTMTRAFRDLPVAEGTLLQMLVPTGTALGGVLFFHEHFTPHEILGAVLILGGTAFATFRRSASADPAD